MEFFVLYDTVTDSYYDGTGFSQYYMVFNSQDIKRFTNPASSSIYSFKGLIEAVTNKEYILNDLDRYLDEYGDRFVFIGINRFKGGTNLDFDAIMTVNSVFHRAGKYTIHSIYS
jgi:hypothetical protein